tara:strand:- start:800 stop:958 length:159 start_codon:yes stop_codon:yes gene_type:complete
MIIAAALLDLPTGKLRRWHPHVNLKSFVKIIDIPNAVFAKTLEEEVARSMCM